MAESHKLWLYIKIWLEYNQLATTWLEPPLLKSCISNELSSLGQNALGRTGEVRAGLSSMYDYGSWQFGNRFPTTKQCEHSPWKWLKVNGWECSCTTFDWLVSSCGDKLQLRTHFMMCFYLDLILQPCVSIVLHIITFNFVKTPENVKY